MQNNQRLLEIEGLTLEFPLDEGTVTAVKDVTLHLDRGEVLGVAAGSLRAREAATAGASIATQMHGAIGFTREHRMHLYTTALWAWRDEFGGQVLWAKLLGQAALDAGGPGFWPMVTEL